MVYSTTHKCVITLQLLYLYVCLNVSLCVSLCVRVSMSLSLCLYLFFYLFVSYISLIISLCLSVVICISAAVCVAPFFVWYEVLFMFGYREETHKELRNVIGKAIALYRKEQAQLLRDAKKTE